jgi:hypothetical protein
MTKKLSNAWLGEVYILNVAAEDTMDAAVLNPVIFF